MYMTSRAAKYWFAHAGPRAAGWKALFYTNSLKEIDPYNSLSLSLKKKNKEINCGQEDNSVLS